MEYFPAGDLQTHCIGDRMDEDDTRHIISQVVRGLEFMHREGFSHGDIKPKVRKLKPIFRATWPLKSCLTSSIRTS